MKTKWRTVRVHDHSKPVKIKWYDTDLADGILVFVGYVIMFFYGYYLSTILHEQDKLTEIMK